MNFDQFMGVVQATGADPYLVLNFDSCNLIHGSGDWSYTQLGQLAVSWAQYIARMGYSVRPRSLQRDALTACIYSQTPRHAPNCQDVRLRHAMQKKHKGQDRVHANKIVAHCTQLLFGVVACMPSQRRSSSSFTVAWQRSICLPASFRFQTRARWCIGMVCGVIGLFRDWSAGACMQVTHFEFSNESYLSVYNGHALAAQYAYAVAQWAPQLRAILPNMKLGANGLPSYDSIGAQDKAQNTNTKWWSTVRACHMAPQACMREFAGRQQVFDLHHHCAVQGGLQGRSLAVLAKDLRVLLHCLVRHKHEFAD